MEAGPPTEQGQLGFDSRQVQGLCFSAQLLRRPWAPHSAKYRTGTEGHFSGGDMADA
jgi:hypothetical protein